MNKKFLSTLLLSSASVAAAGLISLADADKANSESGTTQEEQMPAAIQGLHNGIRDDRLDRHSVDWQRERPFDESKRDHGYYIEQNKSPDAVRGIHDGIRDDRLDRHSVDWQRERPFDGSKRDHGYYIEQNKSPDAIRGIHDGIRDDRLDRDSVDWSDVNK